MEKEQMAEILKKKIQCVECSVDGNCDGACERCILGDDSSEVLEALNHALNLVNREGLKIKDLIEDRKGAFGLSERLLEGRLVALDSKTGHQIFDTRVNTKKTVRNTMKELSCIYGQVTRKNLLVVFLEPDFAR